ncbi:MAG TPA: hypothetical protein VJZ72_00090, partial [Candidatus Limnocylindrales bacterium]|nr:hypothetical protein [Candidatus Limnocylindrales bacterium]
GGAPTWDVAQPTRLVVPVAGRYRVGGGITLTNGLTSPRAEILIRLNGTTVIASIHASVVANSTYGDTIETVHDFEAGDYLELVVVPGAIGVTVVTVAPSSPSFWMHAESGSGARIYRSTNQAIPELTNTKVSFDSVRYDDAGYWSAGDPTVITIPATGDYRLTAHVVLGAETDNLGVDSLQLGFWLNGTQFVANRRAPKDQGGGALTLVAEYRFTAGDEVELDVLQEGGASTDIVAADQYGIELTIQRITESATRVRRTADESTANAVAEEIVWQAERYDDEDLWTSGTDLVIPADGVRHIAVTLAFDGNSNGTRNVRILVNGTRIAVYSHRPPPAPGGARATITLSTDWSFTAGDVLSLEVEQDSGGALGVDSNALETPELSVSTVATTVVFALVPHIYRPTRISIDRSRSMIAGQLDFVLPNESGVGSHYPSQAVFLENHIVRSYQGYGDVSTAIRTFTGVIDKVLEHRDPRLVTVTCRDMMKRLLVESFSATAPQGADEDGAVRTAENGVYLNMEASEIVADMMDRAGVPTILRSISPTSFMVAEYVLDDGLSWAELIDGQDRLTELTGYELWADELGVVHFGPVGQDASPDTDTPQEPTYTWRSGEDLLELDLSEDGYDLKTRVKAFGPYTTAAPSWVETWHTNKIKLPVGLFYDPADTAHLYVLDRSTKKLYKLLQSDQTIVSSVSLTGITYPLGVSGDPSDGTVYWILEAPWKYTGSTSGNKIHKVRRSDQAILATYAIANGRWTTIKVSASNIWLGNWDTDKIHKHSKTDGSSIASYTVTYQSAAQINPTGLAVDGTTLLAFFYGTSGGNRFLILDESDPTTVDPTNALGVTSAVISTAGTNILGGEMDTTTHADLYACSDDLGLVWKYALTTPVTNDVAVVAADLELEHELGERAQTANRVHDLHSGDAAHPFEMRRATLALKLVTSPAQAQESAVRKLAELRRRRLVLDAGIIGNPAIQIRDMVRVEDDVSGLAHDWLLDTYRCEMTAESYIGTVALLPWDPDY